MSRQRLSGFRPWSHQQHLPSSPGPSKELCNHIVGGVGGGFVPHVILLTRVMRDDKVERLLHRLCQGYTPNANA